MMPHIAPMLMVDGERRPPKGQQVFTASGTNFVVPDFVYSISYVLVTAGIARRVTSPTRPGQGGVLSWGNDIPVLPGQTIRVFIDNDPDVPSVLVYRLSPYLAIANQTTPFYNATATEHTDGGFSGGVGSFSSSIGNSGTYTGNGGVTSSSSGFTGGNGIDLVGANIPNPGTTGTPSAAGRGGNYGGGASTYNALVGQVGIGAVRIIWGPDRAYPSTNTGDM